MDFEIIANLAATDCHLETDEIRTKELNLISWHGKEPVLDIRNWNEEHTHCGHGITLTFDEMDAFVTAYIDYLLTVKDVGVQIYHLPKVVNAIKTAKIMMEV